MRSKPIPTEEQFRLVTECRQSGLSDAQWCQQNGRCVNTFYNWISRLRKKGYSLPDPASPVPMEKPDIVRINLAHDRSASVIEPEVIETADGALIKEVKCFHPVMELAAGAVTLRISNEADASLLASLILTLRSGQC